MARKQEEDQEEQGRASFMISDGRSQLKVAALKDCWALQRLVIIKGKDGDPDTESWQSFKYFSDIASVANRVFDYRLKNSEVTTLLELSAAAKQIAIDIRREFSLNATNNK